MSPKLQPGFPIQKKQLARNEGLALLIFISYPLFESESEGQKFMNN